MSPAELFMRLQRRYDLVTSAPMSTPKALIEMGAVCEEVLQIPIPGGTDTSDTFEPFLHRHSMFHRMWRDSGYPVFELSKSCAQELALTRPPEFAKAPYPAFVVTLPTEDSLGPMAMVACVFDGVSDPEFGLFGRKGRDETDPLVKNIPEHFKTMVRSLVGSLCLALTVRQDDVALREMPVKASRTGSPRVTRVSMRTPTIGLGPHVKQYLLTGKHSIASRKAHWVMGFFRRHPGAEAKTIWVRPHLRGGHLKATEPRVVKIRNQ